MIFPTQGSNPVSYTDGQILDHWATREAQTNYIPVKKKKIFFKKAFILPEICQGQKKSKLKSHFTTYWLHDSWQSTSLNLCFFLYKIEATLSSFQS